MLTCVRGRRKSKRISIAMNLATHLTVLLSSPRFSNINHFAKKKSGRTIAIRLGAPLRHRVRGSLLIPYIELNLGEVLPNLLEAVIVGPMNHKEQTAEAIEGLLKENGLSAVKVWCSKTPYRGF